MAALKRATTISTWDAQARFLINSPGRYRPTGIGRVLIVPWPVSSSSAFSQSFPAYTRFLVRSPGRSSSSSSLVRNSKTFRRYSALRYFYDKTREHSVNRRNRRRRRRLRGGFGVRAVRRLVKNVPRNSRGSASEILKHGIFEWRLLRPNIRSRTPNGNDDDDDDGNPGTPGPR